MDIEIYGGINEIGGNKIFISSPQQRFLFDFGLSFNNRNEYFSEFLNPRKFNGIVDFIYLKLLPPLNNLYRNDAVTPFKEVLSKPSYNIHPSEENMVDAFFLTHAHMDHFAHVGFLKQKTPIYMNWVTNTVLQFIEETGKDSSLGGEILSYYELFKMVELKRQKKDSDEVGMKRAKEPDYPESETKRRIHLLEDEKAHQFKSAKGEIVKIRQFPVDHSMSGACAYIVEHDGRSIIYTGDFRRHGLHPQWVDKFLEAAKASNPIAVITEGTRVRTPQDFKDGSYRVGDTTEKDVEVRSRDMIRQHPGLILVSFPQKDLDRILLYYKLAKKFNRIFLVTPKIWKFIDTFRKNLDKQEEEVVKQFYQDYPIPEFNDENLKVYLKRKVWGKFESQDYMTFERDIFDSVPFVTYKDVKKEPERYLLYLDFFMMTDLVDVDPESGSTMYINSSTDPFNEEMQLQEAKLNAWLEHFGILKTETIHSSGHCSMDQLVESLQKINADNVIPIHTENPATFKEFGLKGKIIIPEYGKKYTF